VSSPRVLQVVLQLDPGGTERLVVELVRRLHPRIPMAVCCLDGPGAWAPQIEALGVPLTSLHRQPGFRPGLARRVADAARDAGATVLHCHHYSPFVYGRLAALALPGTRVIYTEHGRLSDGAPSLKRRLVNRLLTPGVSDLKAVSHDLRGHLLREAMPARMKVVWNGIDAGEAPTPAVRAMARAALGMPADARVVMTIARLDPVKDLATLIRAASRAFSVVPQLRLLIVGDGSERPHLEQVAAAEAPAGTVRFLGHRNDARQLLAGADVYANSSTSEGISLTLLEAMAAELPVVATHVGGTPEVVEQLASGWLVPARDPVRLADALVEALTEDGRPSKPGQNQRARVLEQFSIEHMVDVYSALYHGGDGNEAA
jgi:glycosyltransferase involved in cell wall biosynthesis